MMKKKDATFEYIDSLLSSNRIGTQAVYHKVLPEENPIFSEIKTPLIKKLRKNLETLGIKKLYSHQAQAIGLIRADNHVVVSTPTASGKTLIYNIPVLEKMMVSPDSKALYIFPLKALAQDQLAVFREMAFLCEPVKPTAEIYDGDTSAWHRKRIRAAAPGVIMTNPEMMHLSFLPYHEKWADFFSNLKIVVIDEVHTYRGVMGSHMAQVFRRFRRICSHYGASPTFIFSSATIFNPAQLATQLTGIRVETVSKSGAPKGKKHVVFIDPETGPAQTAILLLKAALPRGLRTIVYTQSRKLTELIAIWAGSRSGPYADRISAYRAGFLPEERRDIEAKLSSGELLAVIATSALELGIDIGDLDLCLLVGYPGSVIANLAEGRQGGAKRSGVCAYHDSG